MENVIILIPAFEPSPSLAGLVTRLATVSRGVLIVDDGSRQKADVFSTLPRTDNVFLLTHPTNRGKGAALKTGFAEVLRRFPDVVGVVTADADGQHLPEDILHVARFLGEHPDSLTLGVRTFAAGTPFRSHLGNLWTSGEFFLLTGQPVRDTQTGLRGIPIPWLPRLLDVPGERYEYEIRMLVDCIRRHGAPFQVPIATVYQDGNATSHYRPLADTILTQKALFAALLGL